MSNSTIIEFLEEYLGKGNSDPAVAFHLGRLYLEEGNASEAEKQFRIALAGNPESEAIKVSLARSYFMQRKNSVVLVILEELLEQSNPSADAEKLGAEFYLRTGELDRAKELYLSAVEKDSTLADRDLDNEFKLFSAPKPIAVTPDNQYDMDDLPFDEPDDDFRRQFSDFSTDDRDDMELKLEKSDTKFDDVGGMDAVKEEISLKIIHPLTQPDIYQAYGKSVGGGILMYGPPGCGKTYLARATAGEVNASFLNIGLNDVLDMYLGQSEQNLHRLFETARRAKPTVLFFDEVDALGAKRSDMRQSAGRHLINQFLSEMDGVSTDNDGLLILAATNSPWHLDSAFRRPGRFDRILFIPPPDMKARESILELLLKEKPITEKIDTAKIAKKTVDYSGADLKALVDVAIENKLREAMKAGKPAPLTTKDLLGAMKKIRPTVKEWFATAKNYALYSNQNGLYDDILDYLNIRK